MTQLIVEPSKLEGRVEAQPSKSYTHRMLTIGLLADGDSRISNPLLSLDTKATLEAVRTLGGKVEEIEDGWRLTGTSGNIEPLEPEINVRNSGTTLRLMSAVSALSPDYIQLTGDESILKRPMGPLVKSLSDLGADAECKGRKGRPPVVVGGGLKGGGTRISGTISSQFISALLIVSPYSEVGVDIEVEENLRSKPYVRMTLKTLKLAGGDIRSKSSLMDFSIPGEQIFQPFDFSVPGDFSSAAFVLGAGALTGEEVEVVNLDPKDVQGDKEILDLLRDFGSEVKVKGRRVRVSGGDLHGIDVDCSDTPDLVPVLSILGAVADGWTRLHNVPHLRFKEVDRLKALAVELEKLGAQVKELEDGIKIRGTNRLKGTELDSYGDHRMAMALAVAGLVAEGGVKVRRAESIDVSYPKFVEDMRRLGAKIKVRD